MLQTLSVLLNQLSLTAFLTVFSFALLVCNCCIIYLLIIRTEIKDFKVSVPESLEFNGHLSKKQLLPST